ncbi:MAG: formimidoylglutamase [Bacteroidales bacterium]|nr:formimidoylglutamase [Bacteroidales bacterium]
MEQLENYFAPVSLTSLDYFPESNGKQRIGNNLRLHTEKGMPSLEDVKIAIVGVPEERNAYDNVGCSMAPDEIRKQFYRLFRMSGMPETADLGNFRIGREVGDTYSALGEVLATLVGHGIVPLVLGGSQDLTYANYLAYEQLQEVVNITSIDSRFDIGSRLSENESNAYFHNVVLRQPSYLFNYSNIGYQSYFVGPDETSLMERLRFDACRLGVAQENMLKCEPQIREASIVSVDMSSVRFSDSPGCRHASPNGLNGKEICMLSRFAGAASRVTSFGIYEYNPSCDIAEQSAKLIAEMLWYFLDGFTLRRTDDQPDLMQDNYTRYIVEIQHGLYKINFYEHKISRLWWMEVPCADKKSRYERMYLIPCSAEDYQTACRDELPERWLKTYQKLEKE